MRIPEAFADADLSTWVEFPWPDWVPTTIRAEIERFWGAGSHRGPSDWLINGKESYNHAPEFGAIVSLPILSADDIAATGRFIHCWNNIGRLVLGDGIYEYVCCAPRVPDHYTVLTTEQSIERRIAATKEHAPS